MQQAKEAEAAGVHELPTDVTELQQRVAQLEIDNERLRESGAKKGSSTFGDTILWVTIIAVILGSGFAVARFLFHLSVWHSILTAPIMFIGLVLVLALANKIGLLD